MLVEENENAIRLVKSDVDCIVVEIGFDVEIMSIDVDCELDTINVDISTFVG